MTEGIEQRHVSDGAIILEKALEFIAFSTPTEASDCRYSKDPSLRPALPLGSSRARQIKSMLSTPWKNRDPARH